MKPYFGKFRIASPYGTRTDPITGEGNTWHAGVDLVGLDSKAVRAPVDGTVLLPDSDGQIQPDMGVGQLCLCCRG